MTFGDSLRTLTESGPVLCVGLDPHPGILQAWGCADDATGLRQWAQQVLSLFEQAPPAVVKPQAALFERHGVSGMQTLADLLGALRERGVLLIGDAKRGDIGSTMSAYATAWLEPGGDFEVDSLTLSPYLGLGSLEPALDMAVQYGKGAFVLCATSNPEARTLQRAIRDDGVTLAAGVALDISRFVQGVSGGKAAGVGLVVGATVDQADMGLDLRLYPAMPILAPGFGTQGASLSRAREYFPHSRHLIATVSRSVLEGTPEGFLERVRLASEELSSR